MRFDLGRQWPCSARKRGCAGLHQARISACQRGRAWGLPITLRWPVQPEGRQQVAGASFQGCRGNDYRFTGNNTVTSWRDDRTVHIQVKPAISKHDPRQASQGFGTDSGCVIRCAFTRWSAPLPWPTTGYQLPTLPGWIVKTRPETSPNAPGCPHTRASLASPRRCQWRGLGDACMNPGHRM
jgi:hypothetical protein